MKIRILLFFFLFLAAGYTVEAQQKIYSLSDCINRALENNLQVRQAELTTDAKLVNEDQAAAARFPTLSATARQNFAWSDALNSDGTYTFSGYNNNAVSLNSSMNLFNGLKTSNSIKQARLTSDASKLDVEAMRETISLQVLDAYLQVLYAGEQVTNSRNQLISTQHQMELAKERLDLRIISMADYLEVKAQEANEKLTLANADRQLQLNKVALEQLLELPVSDSFAIVIPDFSDAGKQVLTTDAGKIYETALSYRPEIKSAALQKKIAAYDIEIAKGGYLPSLSLGAGLGTSYSSLAENLNFASQLDHNLSPSIGLTLSVPIFQQKQASAQVSLAKINADAAGISDQDTRNQLRKAIETAWVNVQSSEKEFDAGTEQYNAAKEAFAVATERFNQGVINSVDFLIGKTNLISAESALLQAKYNLIFSYKVLDFYQGKPLEI